MRNIRLQELCLIELSRDELGKTDGGVMAGPSYYAWKSFSSFHQGLINGFSKGWQEAKAHWDAFVESEIK